MLYPYFLLNNFRILYAIVLKFKVASFYFIWIKKTQKINVWSLPTPPHHALRNEGITENTVIFFIETCIYYFCTFFQKS